MKRSIRTRLMRTFMLLLGAALALSIAFTFVGMRFLRDAARLSAEQLGAHASETSREMLVEQALSAAGNFIDEKAMAINQTLDSFVGASREMADYVSFLYEHPDRFPALPVPTPDELVAQGKADGPTLHYLPATKDVQGPEAKAENALLGNLEGVFSVMLSNIPEISSIYTAHESGANIGYDRYAANKAGLGAFDCRNLSWYTAVKKTRSLYVSKAYPDSFNRGLTITLAQPILVNGEFNGVLGVDILIENINSEILKTQYGTDGYAMLFDGDGGVISARDLGEGNGKSEDLLGTGAQAALEAMKSNERGTVQSTIGQQDVYIIYAPVPVAGWKLAVVMPVSDIVKPADASDQAIQAMSGRALTDMDGIINRLNLLMLSVFLVLTAVFIAIVRGACGRVARPIVKLSGDVRRAGEGDLNYRSDIHSGDEIELLGESFERMTASLKAYIANLTRVTAEKERIGAELSVATRIQASMLPCIFPPFPDRPEFDLYALMIPAKEVGGDFYDFFMVDADHLAVVIADVSGKGIPAALFMMTAKTLIKTLAQTGIPPAQVLEEANARLCEGNEAEMFVTAWIGVLEISTGKFAFANAGHNAPLIRRSGERFETLKARPGFVLAGMEGTRYHQAEMMLQPGDMLYLYTDGVTETADPEEKLYGGDRLKRTLDACYTANLKAFLSGVKADIDAFASGADQSDDITMLVLRVDKNGQGLMKRLTVAARGDQLDAVLGFIERELIGCPDKARMRLSLAAEEAFINIARYAYAPGEGDVDISLFVSGDPPVATLVFSDGGMPYNPLDRPDPDITRPAGEREIGGLGVYMIKKNVDEALYRYQGGKNVLTLTKLLR